MKNLTLDERNKLAESIVTKSKHKTVYPEQLETVTEGEAEETDRQLHTENQRQPKQ